MENRKTVTGLRKTRIPKSNYDELKSNTVQMAILKSRRAKLLESASEEISRELEKCPEGKTRVVTKGSHNYYFRRTDPSDANGQYIHRSDAALAEALLKREYLEKLAGLIHLEQNELKCLKLRDPEESLTKMPQNKQDMIIPLCSSDAQWICEWESVEYQGKDFYDTDTEFYTAKGERVRSKSEILIADKLGKFGVPYRYEYPFFTEECDLIYPDFTCLNVSLRRKIIFEHFGMMDDPDYAMSAFRKIRAYERSGLTVGEDFIFTMESADCPLNIRALEEKIRHHLL